MVHALHAAARAHGGGVVEVALGVRKADHRRRPAGASGHLLEGLVRRLDERRAEQQVLGRVPGDRQLGEGDQVGADVLGLLVGGEDARRVPLEVADDEVQLRGRDPDPGHAPKDTASVLRPGGR